MKLEVITVATSNEHKVREISSLLASFGLTIKGLVRGGKLPEETGMSFLANAKIKANYGFLRSGIPTLADDSGLEVDALMGAPGIFSARYAGEGAGDTANNEKLLGELKGVSNRKAKFRCAIVLVLPHMSIEVEGICRGIILEKPRGEGGFGYDPLFYLPEYQKTMAELPQWQKNKISHRGRALQHLVDVLQERGLI